MIFNYANINHSGTLIITDSIVDCMAVAESGYTNVIAILTADYTQEQILFALDGPAPRFLSFLPLTSNSERGTVLDKILIERYGAKVLTVDKSLYRDCESIDQVITNHGADQVVKIVKSGQSHIDGEWNLDIDKYKKLDPLDIKFIRSRIPKLDYSINCIQSKMVTLITGRSNAGKSTLVSQIVAAAVDQSYKVFLALGEGDKEKIINRFYTGLIGANKAYFDYSQFGIRMVKEPKSDVLNAIQKWHEGKLRLWVKAASKLNTDQEMFEMISEKVRRERYDMVILDNQMSLMTVERAVDKLEAQARFVENCHRLAQASNCAVILVLHPNKTYRKGEEMQFEQISGTSDIANKADVILNVIRSSEEDIDESQVNSHIQVMKNRDWSELPKIPTIFDKETFLFQEYDEQKRQIIPNAEIGWKKHMPFTRIENPVSYYEIDRNESPF
jgi:KaiC/GvpD/RAD55 family RecA-like ATPase